MKKGGILYLTLLVMAALLAAGCSRPRSDAQIASEVQRSIYSDSSLHARQISIASQNGVVTLNGSAASDPERLAAAADAATVAGVKTVVNNLQIAPAARAQAPASPLQPGVTPAAPAPAAQPAVTPAGSSSAGSGSERALASAPLARHSLPRRKSQAVSGSGPHQAAKVEKKSVRLADAHAGENSGLPYSVSAPPSSPIGASEKPERPLTPASVPGSDQTGVVSGQTSAVANSPTPKPAAAPVPAPARPPAAAELPPPPPKPVTIPSGTSISVRLLDRIDTETAHPGDSFRATLNTPVVDESGATVIPEGYEVTGKIVEAKSAGRFAGNSALSLELTQLSVNGKEYNLETSQYTRKGKSRGKSTAEKVGGGAALGAVLGGIFGGAKGAAIGATVGAGAGTGVSATGRGEQIVLRPETVLNFALQNSLSVVPTTQSPHGSQSQQTASAPGTSAENHGDDGPPVLKRRPR